MEKEKKKVKFEFSAGAVIFYVENGEALYLLLKYPTYWGFAKGIIEKNGKSGETAIREVYEAA